MAPMATALGKWHLAVPLEVASYEPSDILIAPQSLA